MLGMKPGSRTSWTLRAARPDDLAIVQQLMTVCELPYEDMDGQFGARYVVAEQDGDLVGAAGVEVHGSHGLLRSVGVVPWMRGFGLGTALVRERLTWALENGITSLYLLTMTAEHYFTRHGFEVVERESAPKEIQRSSQFTDLCPSSATLMRYAGKGASLDRRAARASAATCCDGGGLDADYVRAHDPEAVRGEVRDYYARAAREASSGKNACCGGSCGADNPITSDLYDPGELAGIPEDAVRASLGCGNPALLAELREGETVLDLGAGGGIDVLLSARRVGPLGRAYGLDMTDEMLDLARANQRKSGVTNVEFLKGQIEDMPLPDASVDVIISNCVINLSADKRRVLSEAFRVLKPGGRFAVSDIVVRREIPREVRRSAELWAGCVAGALAEWTYRELLRDAGFHDIEVVPTRIFSAEEAGVVTPEVELDELTLKTLDGAFMSAFVRARKPL
jgi:N-acetylglutamate synthase-like GNAT family acetyltransferase/SAM-dependent methyltransferase